MSIVIGTLVGNPRPASRTLNAALALREAIRQTLTAQGHDVEPGGPLTDAADLAQEIFTPGAEDVRTALAELKKSNVLVVASPTYKATYTGLLKSVLDQAPGGWAKGIVAVPLLVAAADKHALAVELHLRPLLVELGAHVPTPGVFLNEAALAVDQDQLIATLVEQIADSALGALVREPLRVS
jgi:FMN reductase